MLLHLLRMTLAFAHDSVMQCTESYNAVHMHDLVVDLSGSCSQFEWPAAMRNVTHCCRQHLGGLRGQHVLQALHLLGLQLLVPVQQLLVRRLARAGQQRSAHARSIACV